MESNHNHEDHSKTSSDEDQTAPDLNNDELAGTGRSYECVFCKRGFTTAQALGGHMNIHRKERAIKTRPTSAPNFTTTTTTTTSTQPVHNNHHSTTLGSYPAIHSTALDDHQLDHFNYTTYIPAPTWVVGHPHALNPSDDHEEEDLCSRNYPRLDHHDQSLFTDNQDWRSGRSLSLGIGPSSQYVDEHHHHHNKQIRVANGGSCTQLGDAHELDLELRLGHDP